MSLRRVIAPTFSGCPEGAMDAKALRARALALLAQREHSRDELRRKLLRAARAAAVPAAQAHSEAADGPADEAGAAVEAEIEAVLEALAQAGWQSDARATESRLRAGAARSGARKLAAELQRRGLAPEGAAWEQIEATEAERARALLLKRFGPDAPADRDQAASRVRFLVNRGFAPGLALRLSRQAADEDPV